MKFQPGNTLGKGGKRENAGRPANTLILQRREFFQQHVPQERLTAILETHTARASAGAADSAKFIFDGYFGPDRPTTEDPLTIDVKILNVVLDALPSDLRDHVSGEINRLLQAGDGS